MIKINDRKKEFMDSRKLKRKGPGVPQRKTEYERQQTHEEVEQIKRDLVNFAQTPWGIEWIRSNLKIGRPFRMQRGIEYVKDKRRIDNLSINPGQIFATVQGTAPTPYRVKINFEIIPKEGWNSILTNLKNKPINLIELLEGNLPEDLIEIFNNTEYSLFPDASKGLDATCSCPDKAIPCKHIAAIILYLAQVIDYNPFLLLELRGKTKNDILSDLSLLQLEDSKKTSEIASDLDKFGFKFNVPQIFIQDLSIEKKKTRLDKNPIHFNLRKPGNIIETLENLGVPQIIENKAFEIVLKAIYQKVTSETYRSSLELDN